MGVREFGTIYEGLLENELSLADSDLAIEKIKGRERYRPAKPDDVVRIPRGHAYLHNRSGARKATGSYFTKHFAVEHLLEYSLQPALQDHLSRLDALPAREAAESFFDFRVADISMGSGHFLVAAVDRIERAFSTYLVKRPLPDLLNELARLRNAAFDALGVLSEGIEIEDTQLLRRQIARRCIYGVDLTTIAVELARLGLWVHTFVPGLPLSFLDHNLVVGNSLVGMATIEEANDWLRQIAGPLYGHSAAELVGSASTAILKLARLSDANAAEILAARAAYEEEKKAVSQAAVLFDILAAARIDEKVRAAIFQNASHWKENLESIVGSNAHQIAQQRLKPIPPFHFPVAFPEVFLRQRSGFDVILGNPPWEKAKVEEDHFWTRHLPGFIALPKQQQEAIKARLRRERRDLVNGYDREVAETELLRRVLSSGPFPGMATGDPDLYKAFCWRFWNLIRTGGGAVGVVLPRSVFAAKGSEIFRKEVFEKGQFYDLTFLLNRDGWVFDDAEHRYTMVLASWQRKSENDQQIPIRGPFASHDKFEKGMELPPLKLAVSDVLDWTSTAAIPLLPTQQSGDTFLQLRRSPRLDHSDASSWQVRPYTELHATADKTLMKFTEKAPAGFWPVYKGESFDIWQPDTKRYYGWANPDDVLATLRQTSQRVRKSRGSLSESSQKSDRKSDGLPCQKARVAFRDVARATDTRTVRAALIPPYVFVVHLAPCLLWTRGNEKDEAFLLGVLSSLPLDWYARRFVETHLTFHLFGPMPIPRTTSNDRLWQRVVFLAGRLASPDSRFEEWAAAVGVPYGKLEDGEKQDMIHELDAVVAHLYGLDERQLAHIFETFHEGWDYKQRLKETRKHFAQWKRDS